MNDVTGMPQTVVVLAAAPICPGRSCGASPVAGGSPSSSRAGPSPAWRPLLRSCAVSRSQASRPNSST